MRLRHDSPDLTWVRWFFADPSKRYLPYRTCFGSLNWSRGHFQNPAGAGEDPHSRRPWSNGRRPPGLPIRAGVCGTPDQFARGASLTDPNLSRNAEGIAQCCLGDSAQGGMGGGHARPHLAIVPRTIGGGGLGNDELEIQLGLNNSCVECTLGVPSYYTLTVSGIVADLACSDCSSLEGSVQLYFDGGCEFVSDRFEFCGGTAVWELNVGGGLLSFRPDPVQGTVPDWFLPADWDCLSPAELTVEDADTHYCDWSGATLSLTQSAVPVIELAGGGLGGGGDVEVIFDAGELVGGGLGGGAFELEEEVSLRRNVAGQTVYFFLRSAATPAGGAVGLAGSIVVSVAGDGGAQNTGAGTVTEDGNGEYHYSPTQAETDFTAVAFTFTAPTTAATATSREFFTSL